MTQRERSPPGERHVNRRSPAIIARPSGCARSARAGERPDAIIATPEHESRADVSARTPNARTRTTTIAPTHRSSQRARAPRTAIIRAPARLRAPLVAGLHVGDVLVHQFELAGAAQNLDLLACASRASANANSGRPLALAVDEVETMPSDEPGRAGDAADRMREQREDQDREDADEADARRRSETPRARRGPSSEC